MVRLIPIITIITPSTIVSKTRLQNATAPQPLPMLDLFASDAFGVNEYDLYSLTLSPELAGLSLAVAGGGTLIAPAAPAEAPTASYHLDFSAPQLKCKLPSPDYFGDLNDSCDTFPADSTFARYSLHSPMSPILYLAWSPSENDDIFTSAPMPDDPQKFVDIGTNSTSPSRIFVYLSPVSDRAPKCHLQFPICSIYNSTCSVDFHFSNGIVNKETISKARVSQGYSVDMWQSTSTSTSFRALMQAFGHIVNGAVMSNNYHGGIENEVNATSTLLLSTNLAQILQKDRLQTTDVERVPPSLEDLFFNITMSLSSNPQFTCVFLPNLTKGLFIMYQLICRSSKDESSSHEPNVTRTSSEQYYEYSPKTLFISYGIALLVSLICTGLAAFAIWDNGACFSSDFSTVMRTTAYCDIHDVMGEGDATGADRIPKGVARARVKLFTNTGGDEGFRLVKTGSMERRD